MSFKIKVKHEKTIHQVELDADTDLDTIKAQLFSVTGVPCARQKLITKGKEIKEGDDLKAILKPGAAVMLMGSAEAVPEAPKELPKFIEDITGTDHVVDFEPPGLKNLQNTCYLNACIQCYRMVPEFRKRIDAEVPTAPPANSESGVLNALKGLYNEMDKEKSGQPVVPMMFVMMCRQFWPQFDEQDNGKYLQQDAEEYCSAVMTAADQALKSKEGGQGLGRLFEGAYEEVMKCVESEDEPSVTTQSTFRILRCNMDTETATIETGLAKAMQGHREKNSEKLGRNAQWETTSKLDRLPEYLWVNLVRFEWRKDINKKTKKLRKCVFPFKLDVFTLCSDGLKARMKAPRLAIKNDIEKALEAKRREKQGLSEEDAPKTVAEAAQDEGAEPMEVDDAEAALGGNNNGFYELCGVVTHQGRDADSGHYVGWTKQKNGRWMCFDDHKVFEVSEDKIQELAGGGEAHSAYLLLYRMRDENGTLAGVM